METYIYQLSSFVVAFRFNSLAPSLWLSMISFVMSKFTPNRKFVTKIVENLSIISYTSLAIYHYGDTESSCGVRQFIMSSIKVIACKRLLGSKTLSHCKMLRMSLSTLLSWNQLRRDLAL